MDKLLNGLINLWIGATGRKRSYADYPWLRGPVGGDAHIGDRYWQEFARREGLTAAPAAGGGLLEDFRDALQPDDPLRDLLQPGVRDFYEHTSRYKLEVWSQWYAPYAIFARTLIRLVSRKMNQLNIPLQPLETSRGMTNEVIHLRDADGRIVYACWLRKSVLTGKVVYSGFYSAVRIDGKNYVRVVFPLPQGSATVVLHTVVQPDGSVKLISDGRSDNASGYYRVRQAGGGAVRVKHVPISETIHVFRDEYGDLRTDHFFSFLGSRLLQLHYKIIGPVK